MSWSKAKSNVSLAQAVINCADSVIIAPLISKFGTKWGQWAASRTGRSKPKKSRSWAADWEVSWALKRVGAIWRRYKSLVLAKNRNTITRTSSPFLTQLQFSWKKNTSYWNTPAWEQHRKKVRAVWWNFGRINSEIFSCFSILVHDIMAYEENPEILNPLNAELNPTCHLLTLFVAHNIFHVSRLGVNIKAWDGCIIITVAWAVRQTQLHVALL